MFKGKQFSEITYLHSMRNIASENAHSSSFWTLALLVIALFAFRSTHLDKKEISWDVFGYYLPLPAVFIYDDPMLDRTDWVKKVNEREKLTSTLYQISTNPEGKPMYFFLFGMAFFFLPFFLLAHGIAFLFDYPMHGFSPPYHNALALGIILYTIIGLWYFRKILLNYFSDKLASLILLIFAFSTNAIHHLSIKNLETVHLLFMWFSIMLWNTIQWHHTFRKRNLFGISLSITFAALIKPSEILWVFVPFLWSVDGYQAAKQKFQKLWEMRWTLILIMLACGLLFLPQMLYWFVKTGKPLYDSYKNPGIGLDWKSPHIIETLFSYRKGWFIYTPVMLLSIPGFILLFLRDRQIFWGILLPFLVLFYVVASWTEWWYGAAFSIRPLIAYYPLLFIPIGFFIRSVWQYGLFAKISLVIFLTGCTVLNVFQWWQLQNYILDPYRTTSAYYWAIFGRTSVTDKERELLLVDRSFSNEQVWHDRQRYHRIFNRSDSFSNLPDGVLHAAENQGFFYTHRFPYNSFSSRDHVWVKIRFSYRTKDVSTAVFAIMVDRLEGPYGFTTFNLESTGNDWKRKEIIYLTPEIRSGYDELKFDFWKKNGVFWLDDFEMNVFERKY
jgi:hypothetical protein